MKTVSRNEWFLLFGLLITAAGLRFYNLDGWSIFGDEIATIVESRDFMSWTFIDDSKNWTLATNPLSHLMTGLTYNIFGESIFSARLVSAVFGVLTPLVFYFLIRRLFTARAAALTAIFITFSPNMIFISGYARYNSILFFFGGASFLLLLTGIVKRSFLDTVAGIVISACAVFSHVTAILPLGVILIVVVIYLLSKDIGNKAKLMAYSGVVAALFAITTFIFWENLLWIWEVITTKFVGQGAGYSPVRLIGSVAYNDGLVHAVFAFLALFYAFLGKDKGKIAIVLYWFVPFLTITIFSCWCNTGPRYLHSALPGFYILCALGVDSVLKSLDSKTWFVKGFLVLFIVASQSPLLVSNLKDGGRYQTLPATEYLLKNAGDDPILAESHQIYAYSSEYRLNTYELPESLPSLLEELRGKKSAFIVYPQQRGVPLGLWGEEYKLWLARNCKLERTFTSKRYDFMRFEIVVLKYEEPVE